MADNKTPPDFDGGDFSCAYQIPHGLRMDFEKGCGFLNVIGWLC